MKKIFLTIIIMVATMSATGQSIFDIEGTMSPNINGTARYIAMGGSFGALGGETSAISDNPAVLGIFRSNELNFSTNIALNQSNAIWGRGAKSMHNWRCDINNFSWVFHFPHKVGSGYLHSNFSFDFHRRKSFNRKLATINPELSYSMTDMIAELTLDIPENAINNQNAYNNVNIAYLSILGYDGGLIAPRPANIKEWNSTLTGKPLATYQQTESGFINSYEFAYSGNISDRFYFGIGLGIQSYFRLINSKYHEEFGKRADGFTLNNTTAYEGSGINLSLGTIIRLASWVRVGASIKTPTTYTFENTQSATLNSSYVASPMSSPTYNWTYQYRSPLQAQFSTGFIIAKKVALNIDYSMTANKTIAFISDRDDAFTTSFETENTAVGKFAKTVHSIKIGGEMRATQSIKLRSGITYSSPAMSEAVVKDVPLNTPLTNMEYFSDRGQIMASTGVGFSFGNIFLDLAYAYKRHLQRFTPFEMYDKAIKGDVYYNNHNLIATLVWKY